MSYSEQLYTTIMLSKRVVIEDHMSTVFIVFSVNEGARLADSTDAAYAPLSLPG